MRILFHLRAAARLLPPVALALICLCAAQAQAEDADRTLNVEVSTRGEEVLVDVNFHVNATPQEVWTVVTDYEHASTFISKLQRSIVLSRTPDMLLVFQRGIMGYGPFSVTIETLAEIHLMPFEELRSHLVSGNLKKYDATTRLIADATGTRVVYHLEVIPDIWLPPLIGRAIVGFEARTRFRQVIAEILRRKTLADPKR